MQTDDEGEMILVSPESVHWEIASWVQVRRYDCDRRMATDVAGPLKSLPLLGSVRRFAIEVVYKDDTWDRTHWLDSPVEAHRIANRLAAEHWLTVRVVP